MPRRINGAFAPRLPQKNDTSCWAPCARHKLWPVPSNEVRLSTKAGRGFALHLNLLQMKSNKNASSGGGGESSARLRFAVELSSGLVCVDVMPSHPNGRIKTRSASKQPQVGFVYEVEMKQSRCRCALGPLRSAPAPLTPCLPQA